MSGVLVRSCQVSERLFSLCLTDKDRSGGGAWGLYFGSFGGGPCGDELPLYGCIAPCEVLEGVFGILWSQNWSFWPTERSCLGGTCCADSSSFCCASLRIFWDLFPSQIAFCRPSGSSSNIDVTI